MAVALATCRQVSKFLHATTGHLMLGLQLLRQLVSEMNYSSNSKSLMQQRKVYSDPSRACISFHEISTYWIRRFDHPIPSPPLHRSPPLSVIDICTRSFTSR